MTPPRRKPASDSLSVCGCDALRFSAASALRMFFYHGNSTPDPGPGLRVNSTKFDQIRPNSIEKIFVAPPEYPPMTDLLHRSLFTDPWLTMRFDICCFRGSLS